MDITSSNSKFSDSGSVEVHTGSSAHSNGGDIILNSGASLDRIPGAIRLQSGGGREIGGNVLIAAGEALATLNKTNLRHWLNRTSGWCKNMTG